MKTQNKRWHLRSNHACPFIDQKLCVTFPHQNLKSVRELSDCLVSSLVGGIIQPSASNLFFCAAVSFATRTMIKFDSATVLLLWRV